jgi:hypothetical protein
MAANSFRRLAVTEGKANFSERRELRTICETINRAFRLSSAGTMYQGAVSTLVAEMQLS